MFLKPFLYLFVFITLVGAGKIVAQDVPVADSLSVVHKADTLTTVRSVPDSTHVDSTVVKPRKEPPFKTRVKYKAADSIKFRIQDQKAFMYKETQINYEDIELKAYETDFNMASKVVYAKGGKDSLDHDIEMPEFKQGSQKFDARSLSYNFDNKKGVIHEIRTQQGEGYLHAEKAKRYPDNHIDLAKGMYTTCDHPTHPHFYLALSKAKVIPGDQTVFGPAHLVLLDIPMPFGLPFGFFPQNNKKAVSGVIPPSIGMEVSRGLSLTNGGYYFAFSDHFDATLVGDIYSTGTWKANLQTRYMKRYKFTGNMNFNYGVTVDGEKGLDQTKTKQYSVQWTHNQDTKANPNRTFSASVNYSSSSYDKEFNYTNPDIRYTNTKNSSINYNQNWPNSPFHLTTNTRVSQNTNGGVDIDFPFIGLTMDRIYPFRAKENAGKPKWYEDITLQYTANLQNSLSGDEGDLFSEKNIKKMRNGFQHSVPFSINFKALKFFNITPSMNYKGVLYASHIKKTFNADSITASGQRGMVMTDTIRGLSYAHSVSPSLSISANPKFYLMNKYGPNSKIEAIRTVISPTVGISYVPDLSSLFDYYDEYTDPNTGKTTKYSRYENYIYGTPTAPGQSGSISVGINGNVEMKVRSDKDSTGTSRKVKIIDRIDARSSYNMFADSLNWSAISLSASTTILGLNLTASGSVDPYKLTPDLRRINQFGPRLTSVNFNTGISLPLQKEGKKDEEKGKEGEKEKGNYSYFDVPWNVSINYTLSYTKPQFDGKFTQNLSFSGSVTLTPKWSLNFSSAYDFDAKQISYTTVSIQRDLHCWQMSINFSPFGTSKYFFFQINVKSSTLQDLKYEKRKSQYDFSNNQW